VAPTSTFDDESEQSFEEVIEGEEGN